MAKRNKETSKLIVKKTDFPTLSGDDVGIKTKLSKGAVQFTSISFPLDYAKKNLGGARMMKAAKPLALR